MRIKLFNHSEPRIKRRLRRNSRQRALYGNFIKLYCLAFFFGLHLVIPIFVPLLQGHGLTMSQILQTQAFFALTVAALELPSGYFADKWGRKRALLIGSAFSIGGFLVLQSAETFADFVLFEVLMGIAASLISGADLALLYDTQTALDQYFSQSGRQRNIGIRGKVSSAKTFARMLTVSSVAECIAGLMATALLFWSIELLLIFQILIAFGPMLIAYSLVETPRNKPLVKPTAVGGNSFRQIRPDALSVFTQRPLLVWTGLTIILFSLVGLLAFWLYQKYWALAGIDIRFFGCIWALYCLIRAIAAQFSERAELLLGSQRLLILVCSLPLISLAGMVFAPPVIGIAFSLLFPLARGLGYVVLIDALNSRIGGAYRATVNSLISLLSRLVFIVVGPMLGLAVDYWGAKTAAMILLLAAAPCLILVTYHLLVCIKADKPEIVLE